MNICIITWSFPRFIGDPSGPFIFDLADNLVKKGYGVHVITPRVSGSVKKEMLGGISVHRTGYILENARGILPAIIRRIHYTVGCTLSAVKIIKEHKIDVIHAFWVVPTGFAGMLASKLTGKPIVVTAAGSDLCFWPGKSFIRFIIKLTLSHINRLITLGTDLKNRALNLGMPETRITVNIDVCGVDTELFAPEKNDSKLKELLKIGNHPLAIYVGRLVAPKKVDYLLEAMYLLKKSDFLVKLFIIGDGPSRKNLENLCRQKGLDDSVVFWGSLSREEFLKFLKAADIFVYASEREGVPTAILEALSTGKPVIASAVGGIPDIIKDGYNGLLVKDNSGSGFSAKLQTLLKDEPLRRKMGVNAREFAESHLSKEIIVPEIEKIYSGLIKDSGK